MDIKELRQKLKMTQKEFGEYLNIPQRTIQSWELGDRTPPAYVLELIRFKIKNERGKKMKKFELVKNSIEINWREKDKIAEGCTLDQGDCDPELIASFDNKDEALEELKKYKSDIRELKGRLGTYYQVTEYYVEENTYDEDGFVEGGGIWEFSEMPKL